MSTSIKLEPATDGTSGDPPVGVFNPAHAVEFFEQPAQDGSWSVVSCARWIVCGEGWGVSEAFSKPDWGESVAEEVELLRRLWVAT
jgi:hypothetical protein